jgi:transposase
MSDGTHLSSEVRCRAAMAVQQGMPIVDVAAAYGVNRKTISRWVSRFENEGSSGLQRKAGSGRPRKLEDLSEQELCRIVLQGAAAFGYEADLWTVARLRRVIADQFGVYVSKNTIWRRLREAGLTYQKPEREYYEIDEATREKWLRDEVPKIRKTVQKYRGILYFQENRTFR